MNQPYTFYGWHASYFAGKARTYLNYKQVPLAEPTLTLWTLMGPVKRHTGAAAMPALRTPSRRACSASQQRQRRQAPGQRRSRQWRSACWSCRQVA